MNFKSISSAKIAPITVSSSTKSSKCVLVPQTSALSKKIFKYLDMSVERLITISPSTNKPILERNGVTDEDIATLPKAATDAFNAFRRTTLAERQAIIKKALKGLEKKKDGLAKELTEQMGRPIAYTAKEITTAVARAEYLLKISDDVLKDTDGEPERGFKRYIRKVPVGPVLILFAWNVGTFTRVASRVHTDIC